MQSHFVYLPGWVSLFSPSRPRRRAASQQIGDEDVKNVSEPMGARVCGSCARSQGTTTTTGEAPVPKVSW